jgi:hypothetical protein
MSTFEDYRYRWRETYFVLFDKKNRPKLDAVAKTLKSMNNRYELSNQSADKEGFIESLTLISPEDYAALDICYTCDDEVTEQAESLIEDLRKYASDTGVEVPVKKIRSFQGRFDVLHFERVSETPEEDDDEMLDPSALLIVLETMAKLTGGISIDPQSGTILDNT